MPRRLREATGGMVFHVLNRAVGRSTIFENEQDYRAFERTLWEAIEFQRMRVLSYCIMPNHWHLVLRPWHDGDLSRFMRWLTVTHTQRFHAAHHTAGTGPVYQGRFKSFPVETDEHLFVVCRYVERNPVRAHLVRRAQNWHWGSLWHRVKGKPDIRKRLDCWPDRVPDDWTRWVNSPLSEKDLESVRVSVSRGRPFGSSLWQKRVARRLGLDSTLRDRGRPRKQKETKRGHS